MDEVARETGARNKAPLFHAEGAELERRERSYKRLLLERLLGAE